jgi:beta-glucosidase/6-phospho-beta-glucosidase/beta-galactosidase
MQQSPSDSCVCCVNAVQFWCGACLTYLQPEIVIDCSRCCCKWRQHVVNVQRHTKASLRQCAKPQDSHQHMMPLCCCCCCCRWRQDVALMKQLGLKHFRLSLAWPRLLPGARKGSAVNPDAVRFYGAVLDELKAAGGHSGSC